MIAVNELYNVKPDGLTISTINTEFFGLATGTTPSSLTENLSGVSPGEAVTVYVRSRRSTRVDD
jgi:hypothetical protein